MGVEVQEADEDVWLGMDAVGVVEVREGYGILGQRCGEEQVEGLKRAEEGPCEHARSR